MKLFIFGSTGDLVKRKVFPALKQLHLPDLEIFALGRKELKDEGYRKILHDECGYNLSKNVKYIKIDFNKEDICFLYNNLLDKNNINYFYVSLPPSIIDIILLSLAKIKGNGYKIKILIEKPFGENLAHSIKLKKLISDNNIGNDLFISDHYLFKDEIINLKKQNFNKLKIISLEEIGLAGRISYYDNVGAIKDMIQSHFFNILYKLIKINEKDIDNIRVIDLKIGQYGNGKDKGYVREINKNSQTETLVYLKLNINNKIIEFITGKSLDKKDSYIIIDNRKITINHLNPYKAVFLNFFKNKKELFPKVEDAILSWRILEKLPKKELLYYKEGSSLEEIERTYF